MSTGPAALHPFGCALGGCWGTLGHFVPALNLTLSSLSRLLLGRMLIPAVCRHMSEKPQTLNT